MKTATRYPHFLSKAMIFALLGLIAVQPDPAIAKIYKYKDEQGRTHFTDDASKIPLRYRKKGTVKKFREVNEPSLSSQVESEPSKKDDSKDKGDGILSAKEIVLVNRTMQVFDAGVALGEQYKNAQPNFSNGIRAVNAIQAGLALKESLANDLEGTKVPELQAALGFLKQSISVDKQTQSIGAGLKRRIVGIYSRLISEGEQQAELIKKLEKALKTSEKKKAEAAKKKEEEAKKKEEEARREAEEARRKAEEEAAKEKAEKEAKQAAEKAEKKKKEGPNWKILELE